MIWDHATLCVLSGVVRSLLITKHILFVGFSLTDDSFNQIAASVRRSLLPLYRKPSPSSSPSTPASPPSPSSPSPYSSHSSPFPYPSLSPEGWREEGSFGSTLTLSERPFLSELWPELRSVPMGEGSAEDGQERATR